MVETPLSGRRVDGLVALREGDPRGMVALKGDLSASALSEVAAELAGVAFPGPGEANVSGASGLLWMAPDEVLLTLPPERTGAALARIGQALDGVHHLAAEVSDMRAVLRLDGPEFRDVLGKLTPADLSPAGLPPGRIRRTRLGQVAAAIWCLGDNAAELLCFRSVAQYVFELVANAAQPDSAVRHHERFA